MEVKVLIDSIVRQTTILIAQLATAGGVRAPLAHIANQTFLSLVNELEGQGLGRMVIADMFGMALRSYQQKVQRLSESATDSGVTLWEATYRFMLEKEVANRAEILKRFRHDRDTSVRGILNDLVESGLIYRSGRGDTTLYRVIPEEDVNRAGLKTDPEGTAMNLVWLTVYRHSPVRKSELCELLSLDEDLLEQALDALVADGRVSHVEDGDELIYKTDSCLIKMGDHVGWEASVFDHFQAVVASVCNKLQNGHSRALPDDQVGGSTFRFDVWPGHPLEEEACGLLAKQREEISELWDRVSAYSSEHNGPVDKKRVTF